MLAPQNAKNVELLRGYAKWLKEFLLFVLEPVNGKEKIDNRLLVIASKFTLFDFFFDLQKITS